MTLRALVGSLVLVLAASAPGAAADHLISGARLTIKTIPNGRAKVVFVSRDPALVLPAVGGPDDPRYAPAGSTSVEIFLPDGGRRAWYLPADGATPGWRATSEPHAFRYVHRSEVHDGGKPQGSLRLRSDGASSLIRSSFVAGEFDAPIGPVGVRVTTGSIRSCVRFDAPTIRRDEQGRFVAARAQAGTVVDCEHATLSGLVACGDSDAPACGGFCENDQMQCVADGASGCHCAPPPPPPCGDEIAYFCEEGACPEGSSCNYTADLSGCFCQSDSTPCGDSGPICNGACPLGQECGSINGFPGGNGGCACLPAGSIGCGRSEQCGGDCPDGLQCYGYTSYHPFSWCACSSSPPCGPTGCPPGKTCSMLPPAFWPYFGTYGCVPF